MESGCGKCSVNNKRASSEAGQTGVHPRLGNVEVGGDTVMSRLILVEQAVNMDDFTTERASVHGKAKRRR